MINSKTMKCIYIFMNIFSRGMKQSCPFPACLNRYWGILSSITISKTVYGIYSFDICNKFPILFCNALTATTTAHSMTKHQVALSGTQVGEYGITYVYLCNLMHDLSYLQHLWFHFLLDLGVIQISFDIDIDIDL